jgi:hypothetical protein
MKELLERLRKAEEAVNTLRAELYSTKDGFFYYVKISSYGNHRTQQAPNLKVASEICDNYNGDNGFVELTTNNPKASKLRDGEACTVIIVKSKEEYNNKKDELTFLEAKEKEPKSTVQDLEDVSHFKHHVGLNVINDDNYWLTSDEDNS